MSFLNKVKAMFAENEDFKAERHRNVVHVENVYANLLDLPQFIKVEEGALNVMNGCLVELYDGHLQLIWHRGGSPTIAHSFYLPGRDVDKFLSAMVLQANLKPE